LRYVVKDVSSVRPHTKEMAPIVRMESRLNVAKKKRAEVTVGAVETRAITIAPLPANP